MKEFIISEAQTEKAVLVGLVTPEQNEQKVKEYLDELAGRYGRGGCGKAFYPENGLPEFRHFCRDR